MVELSNHVYSRTDQNGLKIKFLIVFLTYTKNLKMAESLIIVCSYNQRHKTCQSCYKRVKQQKYGIPRKIQKESVKSNVKIKSLNT